MFLAPAHLSAPNYVTASASINPSHTIFNRFSGCLWPCFSHQFVIVLSPAENCLSYLVLLCYITPLLFDISYPSRLVWKSINWQIEWIHSTFIFVFLHVFGDSIHGRSISTPTTNPLFKLLRTMKSIHFVSPHVALPGTSAPFKTLASTNILLLILPSTTSALSVSNSSWTSVVRN